MRARLEAVAVARPDPGEARASSVALAAEAGLACLARAGREPAEVEVLVNCGVYRDENIGEPAMAPFIQRRMGANAAFPPSRSAGTLSFDLCHSTCGFLSALRVVAGFIESGRIRCGMVVASDVDPAAGSRGLALDPLGAAVLLAAGDGREGFAAFHAETFPRYAALYESRLSWVGDLPAPARPPNRDDHAVLVRQDEKYVTACVDCAESTVRRFLAARGMEIEDLHLIVASRSPAGFSDELGRRLEAAERVPPPSDPSERVHAAGTGLALAAAMEGGMYARASRTLLVAAGPGVSVALALYTKDADRPRGG